MCITGSIHRFLSAVAAFVAFSWIGRCRLLRRPRLRHRGNICWSSLLPSERGSFIRRRSPSRSVPRSCSSFTTRTPNCMPSSPENFWSTFRFISTATVPTVRRKRPRPSADPVRRSGRTSFYRSASRHPRVSVRLARSSDAGTHRGATIKTHLTCFRSTCSLVCAMAWVMELIKKRPALGLGLMTPADRFWAVPH